MLAASLAAHLGLFVAWMSTRPELRFSEAPTMEVTLVRPSPHAPPKPPPPPRTQRPPRAPSAVAPQSAVAEPPPAASQPTPQTPRQLTDEELLAGPRPSASALRNGPIREGRATSGFHRPCKTSVDHSMSDAPPCSADSAEELAARWEAAKDAKTAGFEATGRYKRAMKTYKEAPGGAGYPGIACAILHRC